MRCVGQFQSMNIRRQRPRCPFIIGWPNLSEHITRRNISVRVPKALMRNSLIGVGHAKSSPLERLAESNADGWGRTGRDRMFGRLHRLLSGLSIRFRRFGFIHTFGLGVGVDRGGRESDDDDCDGRDDASEDPDERRAHYKRNAEAPRRGSESSQCSRSHRCVHLIRRIQPNWRSERTVSSRSHCAKLGKCAIRINGTTHQRIRADRAIV